MAAPTRAAILEISPEVFRSLLGLPVDAVLQEVRSDILRMGVLQLKVTGVGWEVRPGEMLRVAHATMSGAPNVAQWDFPGAQRAQPTLSDAMLSIVAERWRQQYVEGWSAAHDDAHADGGLAYAAACYALIGTAADSGLHGKERSLARWLWNWTGWASAWFKPKDRRRDLVRAAALLVAEIERLDRRGARQLDSFTS